MREYVNQVVSASTRRALRRNAAIIVAQAEDERTSMDELLDDAEKRILSLRRSRSDEGVSMADLIGLYMPRFDSQLAGSIVQRWVADQPFS